MYSMKISKAIAGPDYIVDIYNDGAHIKTRNHPCPYQLIAIYDSRFDLAEFKQTLPPQ